MGSMIGWHCNNCGAEESFLCGGGMMGLNEPAVVDYSKDATFGIAMKTLFADGIPDGWTVITENAFYLCPNCGGVIHGSSLRIDDGGPGWLVYHAEPRPCPTCGEKLLFRDDKHPMSGRELFARCEGYAEQGCPKCGNKDVGLSAGEWD